MRALPPVYSPLSAGAVAASLLPPREPVDALLRARFECSDILFTDSGTGALTLAMRAARTRYPDSPVALPGWGCYDLATAADGAGVPVLLYDVDPGTLGPDMASLTQVVAEGAAIVVLVHFYGLPVDVAAIRAQLPVGTLIIEDAAQAAGASVSGRVAGSLGDVSILSFGRGKGMTAGRGGALLACEPSSVGLVEEARRHLGEPRGLQLKDTAMLAAQWLLARPGLYAIPLAVPGLGLGDTVYHPPRPVRRMTPAALSVLALSLARADRERDVRRANAARLLATPRRHWRPVTPMPGGEPGYLRLPLYWTGPMPRPDHRRLGIMPGYPRPLATLPGFDRVENRDDRFEHSRRLAERLVTVPTHGLLSAGDLAGLEDWLGRTVT